MFSTIKELVALATEQKKPISEIMIEQENGHDPAKS